MGLCGLPDTVFVRAKDICQCLGITQWELNNVVDAGLIHRFVWGTKKRGKYLRAEVLKVFMKGVNYDVLDMGKKQVQG